MDELFTKYERELVIPKSLCREYAQRYPKGAAKLQLGGDTCDDPHGERLSQGVALLSARVPKRVDESYAQFTEALAKRVWNAGAVFVGEWTAQVAGDYAIGSNHVLPTAGAARYRGGVNAADFVKLVSVQRMTKAGLQRIAGTVTTLARAEGLEAHARSIEVRLKP